jgi:hypothetical protein
VSLHREALGIVRQTRRHVPEEELASIPVDEDAPGVDERILHGLGGLTTSPDRAVGAG